MYKFNISTYLLNQVLFIELCTLTRILYPPGYRYVLPMYCSYMIQMEDEEAMTVRM